MATGDGKEGSDHLLTLTHPFGGKRGGADAEKGRLGLSCDALADQGFASSWRPEQQKSLGRASKTGENVPKDGGGSSR